MVVVDAMKVVVRNATLSQSISQSTPLNGEIGNSEARL